MPAGATCALVPTLLQLHPDKILAAVFLGGLCGSLVYSVLQIVASLKYLSVQPPPLTSTPALSILKPLAGLDLDLESNLQTFFEQDYPSFEILFALRHGDDPAAEVVRRLQ